LLEANGAIPDHQRRCAAGAVRMGSRIGLPHTFACSWVDRGGSLAALQHLLDYSSITVTQRYGRISDSMVRAEVMRLASVASAVDSEVPADGESVG